MNSNSLILFAKTISGHFSNKEQAQKNPNKFAHINIYFIPIPSCLYRGRGPAFYSEQSFDHSPWAPYKQAFHKFRWDDKKFIIENYKIKEQERIAGAGLHPNLLENITFKDFTKRIGCSMHFLEIKSGNYIGKIEPGKKCTIKKEGVCTYVDSKVELNSEQWISEDSGFNVETNEKSWGSKYGPLKFSKVLSYSNKINAKWLT